jgi:hypothetical protein
MSLSHTESVASSFSMNPNISLEVQLNYAEILWGRINAF